MGICVHESESFFIRAVLTSYYQLFETGVRNEWDGIILERRLLS